MNFWNFLDFWQNKNWCNYRLNILFIPAFEVIFMIIGSVKMPIFIKNVDFESKFLTQNDLFDNFWRSHRAWTAHFGDSLCWWQVYDATNRFKYGPAPKSRKVTNLMILSPTFENYKSYQHDVVINIKLSPLWHCHQYYSL